MEYTVLSPWAKSNHLEKFPISPRLESLKGKTIGLYASFKEYHPFFMRELERQLGERLPDTIFSHYTYIVDTCEIANDKENLPSFKKWLDSVDAVVGVGADMGSCALYMGYNFAYIESQGVPAVLLSKHQYLSSASKGAAARSYPGLRIVTYDGPGFVPNGVDCNEWTVSTYRGTIANMLDKIIDALTKPLTEEEKNPKPPKDWSDFKFTGTLDEINSFFYERGWTNGSPIVPPTEEAVEEMLRGTDLPGDYVVAELPPMMGRATVEKIAVNGIMAGCLPTYMPLLIAAVEGMADDIIKLEGWTCSNAGWAPTVVISGPIRKDIGINTGRNLLSPYTRPSACIAKAIAYMIMNISGVRSQTEDMSGPGSDCRFGICIAENEEESPWEPLQTDFGFGKEDSCVTLFWPSEHTQLQTVSVSATLGSCCKLWHG
ncbi:MAG: UGSC family (seleno)protein, partial [Oscillospiraceae bacterium]